MVEIFEGERAVKYDNFVDTWIPNYREFLQQIPQLLDDVGYKKLLVTGCGTGNEILALGDSLNNWQVTGIDPSPEMLEQAKVRLSNYGNVRLKNCQVTQLPEDEFYGAATLILVLHFLKDNGSKLDLLTQISDRLEQGAPFIMLDITGSSWQIHKNLDMLSRLIQDGVDSEDLKKRMKRIETELFYVPEERLTELLMQAGFEKPVRFYQNTIYMGWFARKS